MPGLGFRLSTDSIRKRGCLKSGCSGTLRPGKLGLSCKANIFRGAGAADLGVPPTQETSPMNYDYTKKNYGQLNF